MSKIEYNFRYKLIIEKLRKAPATFKEILNKLEIESEIQGYNLNVSKRTFQRDIKEIASLYDIEIEYDFSRQVYFIADDPQSDANMRMLEAFDLFQAMKLSENLTQHICFEKRKSQGTQYLLNLLQAIKNQQFVEIQYLKFYEEKPVLRKLQSLALKETKGRWYLVAKDENDGYIKTYGLDRIEELTVLKLKFIRINFEVNEYFKDCFGIIKPINEEPQKVLLSFTNLQAKYIKNYPLHSSQQIVEENETETQFSFFLYITFDLIQELLSHGNMVKVIQPEFLKMKV